MAASGMKPFKKSILVNILLFFQFAYIYIIACIVEYALEFSYQIIEEIIRVTVGRVDQQQLKSK